MSTPSPGTIARTGYRAACKWLLLRRSSQVLLLLLFLAGPGFGLWIVKGNLNYSYTLNVLPLADPYLLLQSMLSGRCPQSLALAGAALVVLAYLLPGGRSYCSWVCPVNLVTDCARWLRHRWRIQGGARLSRDTRFWMLGMTLVVSLLTGTLAWEMVNPVSMLHRGLLFGMGLAWIVLLAVFLFDLLVVRDGWCGHLCPVGAFYSLIGKISVLRVELPGRSACNDCMECFAVCPEPQVIRPPLKAVGGAPALILDARCTRCGRCIDVCSREVFAFGSRWIFPGAARSSPGGAPPSAPD